MLLTVATDSLTGRLAREGAAGHASATRTVTQIRNTAANALLLTAFLLSGTITSMDRVPMDIGEWISEDAKKGALEAGAWMADHPDALFEMTERDRKCRTAYIRELKTAGRPKSLPRGTPSSSRTLVPRSRPILLLGRSRSSTGGSAAGRRSTGPPPSRP